MKTRARWTPILDGAAAERARRVVLDIAEVLRASRTGAPFPDGPAARALYFGYLAEVFGDPAWSDAAAEQLDAAIAQLEAEPLEPTLFHGFVGTAWVVEHLQGHLLAADDDLHASVDDALLTSLHGDACPRYELMHGLTGLGFYGWERQHRPSGRALLAAVIARLDELALRRDEGITWLTLPVHLHEDTRRDHPDGRFTLGTAHGVPATLPLLALAAEAGFPRARPLLDGAVRWLLQQRRAGQSSRVPRHVDVRTGAAQPSRLAWCFGDAGAGTSLLWAARVVGNRDWLDAATEIVGYGASRPLPASGVVDAGFCHGAAGNAHLFNRAYHAIGDERLRHAAVSWLDHALAFRHSDGPSAGFVRLEEDGPVADESLLSGIAGIGLALLAASSDVEPEWDRLFAAAAPPL